jgi:predicted phosphodiesterase
VLFCHATARNDTEIFTKLSPEERVRTLFSGVDAAIAVCGHTHMQFDRVVDSLRVVNAGSVGMPFGEPGAYWLLLGPGVHLRFTSYDLESAVSQVNRSAFPGGDLFTGQVVAPRSASEMLALYSKADH